MRIRRARPADMDQALRVIGDAFKITVRAPSVHTLVASAPDGHLLVAEHENRIVGTGASIGFGATGWVGAIAVASEARGKRLGQALTEAALEALGPRTTVLLLASDAGGPIYERLGFEPDGRYRTFAAPPNAVAAPSLGVRPITPAHRHTVLALDARATGEDRELAVDAGLAGGLITADLQAVALRPPWPARPILARDPAAGATLLAAVLEPGLRLAVPEANATAVTALLAHGATEGAPVVRMHRGLRPKWRPEEIWGVFSLFFG